MNLRNPRLSRIADSSSTGCWRNASKEGVSHSSCNVSCFFACSFRPGFGILGGEGPADYGTSWRIPLNIPTPTPDWWWRLWWYWRGGGRCPSKTTYANHSWAHDGRGSESGNGARAVEDAVELVIAISEIGATRNTIPILKIGRPVRNSCELPWTSSP